jgi:CBS domain-containing protein
MVQKEKPPDAGTGPPELEIADEDIFEAMREIPGYLDITPSDFKEVYLLALRYALERLRRGMKAKDVMTKEVVWVNPDAPLAEVAELMARREVSGIPVVAQGKVVGVISEKDFLFRMGAKEIKNFMSLVAQCLKEKGCKALPLRGQTAKDIMAAPAVTVKEDTPIIEIARIFLEQGINRVLVTDAQDHLLGIVSRNDVIKATGG